MSDDRLKKTDDPARVDRALIDRAVTESRELTEADRLQMFRQQLFSSTLPDLPKIPGFHVCWLTTTNPRDSIQGRIRLGYEPVTLKDVPGWEHATLKTGEYIGLIAVNEMVAFKLPQTLYEAYMKEAHHDEPLRQEDKLTEAVRLLAEQAEESKSKVTMGDGTAALGKVRDAVFTE